MVKTVVSKATDEIVYLSADDERKHYVTHAEVFSDETIKLKPKEFRPDLTVNL